MKADPHTSGAQGSTRARRHQRSAQSKAAGELSTMTGSASNIASSMLEGPSHVLFSALGATAARTSSSNTNTNSSNHQTTESKRKRLPMVDPRLEIDYVYKRRRAHEVSSLSKAKAVSATVSPWDGVSALEQELIKCCEALPDDFYNEESDEDNNNNNNKISMEEDENNDTDGANSSSMSPLLSLSPANPIGGVLAIEKECRFAAILSRGCHTMASRSLAIAILERTLEAYLEERAISAFLLRQQKQKDKDEEANVGENNNIGRSTRERVERAKTLAGRQGHPFPNNATTPNENESAALPSTIDNTFLLAATEDNRRFRLFFAAGGLRILNQWLADASSYETTATSSSPLTCTPKSGFADRGKNSNTVTAATKALTRKAHTTRPIALSILLFLEHIPFEKKIVTNSKINKQVQKLGKKVLSIQEAHQKKEAPMEDIQHWTNQKSHDQALTRTLEAIDAVKSSWREKAKAIKGERKQLQVLQQQANPFGLLQSRIRERLNIWNQFQSGALSTRPEWYRAVPASAKKGSSPRNKKANNEAQTEKRILEKKIKQMQSRSQKSLKQLREKLRKHNHHTHSAANQAPSSLKRVSWRDGLKSQVARNRQALEDVAVFGKEMPPSSVDRDDTHPDRT